MYVNSGIYKSLHVLLSKHFELRSFLAVFCKLFILPILPTSGRFGPYPGKMIIYNHICPYMAIYKDVCTLIKKFSWINEICGRIPPNKFSVGTAKILLRHSYFGQLEQIFI